MFSFRYTGGVFFKSLLYVMTYIKKRNVLICPVQLEQLIYHLLPSFLLHFILSPPVVFLLRFKIPRSTQLIVDFLVERKPGLSLPAAQKINRADQTPLAAAGIMSIECQRTERNGEKRQR